MAEGTRSYSSPLRADQARQTRKRIVDAAAELFAERGYTGTTVDAVAAAAGVSRKTVFDSIGGKARLMKFAYDFAIVGDDEPVALKDRPRSPEFSASQIMASSLPCTRLSWSPSIGGSQPSGELSRAPRPATPRQAGSTLRWSPSAASPAQEAAQLFADTGALRPDVDVDIAADLLRLYNDPSLFDKLVRQRGWSVARFQDWLTEALQVQLLGTD